VTLEDLEGLFEVIVFSDLYARASGLLTDDALVMISGRVSYRDSEPKLIAEDVVPIDNAEERFARTAHVKFLTAGTEEHTLEQLARVVDANQGDCKLFLHCVTPDGQEVVIEANSVKGLKPSLSAKEQIESVLTPGALWFSASTERKSNGG
jgi:DNA polymerase-3 subunit alpha